MTDTIKLKWGKREVEFRLMKNAVHYYFDVGTDSIVLRREEIWWAARHQTIETRGATAQIAVARLYLWIGQYAENIADALKAGE